MRYLKEFVAVFGAFLRIEDSIFDRPDCDGTPENPSGKIHPALNKDQDQHQQSQPGHCHRRLSEPDQRHQHDTHGRAHHRLVGDPHRGEAAPPIVALDEHGPLTEIPAVGGVFVESPM